MNLNSGLVLSDIDSRGVSGDVHLSMDDVLNRLVYSHFSLVLMRISLISDFNNCLILNNCAGDDFAFGNFFLSRADVCSVQYFED